MKTHDVFWKLDALSDRQLLERVGSMLGSSRRLMAELIAHLGEVEERRLHLAAACSSMFAYCLTLGMTEDEAYRRIEVARLARRYPAIFPLLADGRLSISVVALLKHHLSVENHLDLLASAAGKTVAQTRELIAARFPRPDIPSSVRKLPERRTMSQPSLSMSTPTAPCTGATAPCGMFEVQSSTDVPASPAPTAVARSGGSMTVAPTANATCSTAPEPPPPSHSQGVSPPPSHSQGVSPPPLSPLPPSSRIEPLSARRYKVQLTATAELARKLELAKDLMRHSHPDGELGPIVERALDLLIERLMQRRFGKKARPKPKTERARHARQQRSDIAGDRSTMPDTAEPDTSEPDTRTQTTSEAAAQPSSVTALATKTPLATTPLATTAPATTASATTTPATTPDSADVQVVHRGEPVRATTSSYVPRSTRRAVVERDGFGCSWVDEHGVRCGSQAWLEYDHRHPRAKGGGGEPANVRLLCRQHNRFAAELEYGRRHVEHAIAERRRAPAPHVSPDVTGA